MKKNITKPKAFYHSVIDVQKIHAHLEKVELKKDEHLQVWDLIEETIHIRILDTILEKLPEKKHEEFLEKFHKNPQDKKLLLELESEIKDIKKHIHESYIQLEKETLEDINKIIKMEK